MIDFALNHMAVPSVDYRSLISMASRLGCVGVEFRNDFSHRVLFEGDDPATVGKIAADTGIRILALAEVKMFNAWSPAKADEALALMKIAKACGAEAVSLIPRNDAQRIAPEERAADVRQALAALLPMLQDHGLRGMVEPLGFEACPLRFKDEAVAAIADVGGQNVFRLVHDTFHHHLAGGGPLFAAETGIVHVSGVTDPALPVAEMRDGHRVLVDADDVLGNVAQIRALRAAGYTGPVSYEPFAPSVHSLKDPETALARSMAFIRERLAS